jgi:hypothetical protein
MFRRDLHICVGAGGKGGGVGNEGPNQNQFRPVPTLLYTGSLYGTENYTGIQKQEVPVPVKLIF